MHELERPGQQLRRWRARRHRSQLDLAIAAGVSSRHVSFIETGRSMPSREMIERLCDELDVPLRERNLIYLAAGLAPQHPERPFAELAVSFEAIEAILESHEPHPTVAVDARWDLLAANASMRRFLAAVPAQLRTPRLNMMRAALHPEGLATRIANAGQWRELTLRRVRRQLERTGDAELAALLAELEGYPTDADDRATTEAEHQLATPMLLETPAGRLSLLYAVTVFGSARDVTLDEIAIETFLPSDSATRERLAILAAAEPVH